MNWNLTHVAAAGVLGLLLGGVVCWRLVAGESPAPPDAPRTAGNRETTPAVPATPAAREREAVPGAAEPPAGSAGDGRVTNDREEGALFTERLRAFARAEAAGGWRELRRDAVPAEVVERALVDYEDQLRTRARWFGRAEAEKRNLVEAKAALLAATDGVALLAAIGGDEPEAKEFVQSERFTALFAQRGGGSGIDGTSLTTDAKIPDGAVVSFPAGVYAVADFARGNDPFPTDLTVRGAGMDATLLVWDAQRSRTPMQRFAVEDCTVFVDSGLTDIRQHPAVLSLRRVRVVGFDCGAGGSVAFYLQSCAMHAVQCRFESGYGRNPHGYANLLSPGGASLARFEHCSFERVSLIFADKPAITFVDCTLTEMLDPQPTEPTFRNCRYSEIPEPKKWDADYRRRDLNTLFPQWKERLQRR